MRILLICHKIPFPLHDGGACSIYHTAMGLAGCGADVHMLAVDTPKNPVDLSSVPPAFMDRIRFESVHVDTRIKPFRLFINLAGKSPYFVERFRSAEFAGRLKGILREKKFDIIQMEHLYMCLYLDVIRAGSEANVILRPQNVENKIWRQLAEERPWSPVSVYFRISARRLRRFEEEMARRVDGIMAISGADQATFREYAPHRPVTAIPIGFDFSRVQSVDLERQYAGPPVFYHLGSMDWRPNRQGIRWFIQKVIPHVKKDDPGFVFIIAGKKMPASPGKKDAGGLRVDPDVEDSIRYQEDKSVLVVPLLSGSGIRAKIVEGMAMGKTVISTSVGASGIPYTNGKDILIADTPEEFAFQIRRCRESETLRRHIGLNAVQLAREHYDMNRTGEKMTEFYRDISNQTKHLQTR